MTEYNDAGKTTTAKIDLSNPGKLIGMLSAPYNDPVLAVVREYLANAIDSHVASGQHRPVEVSLPSHRDPRFRVRDYGTGLTWDQVSDLYFNYSASTKEHTDEEIGNLGLGSKAAFAVSETWRLTTTAQGQTWVIEVMRDPSGVPQPRVVYHGPSSGRDDGIEVSVDVNLRDYPDGSWIAAMKKLALWLPGRSFTLVGLIGSDGDFPTVGDEPTARKLTETLCALSGHAVDSEITAVMCGIPYLVTKPMSAAIRDRVLSALSAPDLAMLHRFGYGYPPSNPRNPYSESDRIIQFGGGIAVLVPPGTFSINLQRETVPATAANLDAVAGAVVTELRVLTKRLRRVCRPGTPLLESLLEWAAVLPEGDRGGSLADLLASRPEWRAPLNHPVWFCSMDTVEASTIVEVVERLVGAVYRGDRRSSGYHERVAVVADSGSEPERLDYFLRYHHLITGREVNRYSSRGYRTPVVWSEEFPKEILPLLDFLADPKPDVAGQRLQAVLSMSGYGVPCEVMPMRRSDVISIAAKAYQRFGKPSASKAYRLSVLQLVP